MDRPGELPPRPPAWAAPRVTVAEYLRQCLSEFRKILWPNRRAVRTNVTVMLLIVMVLIFVLATLELAVGNLSGGLYS